MTQTQTKSNHELLVLEYEQAKLRLSRTKYVLLAAILLWPLGLFISALVSFLIFAVLFALWGVSTYIAFMHYWSAKKRLPGHMSL